MEVVSKGVRPMVCAVYSWVSGNLISLALQGERAKTDRTTKRALVLISELNSAAASASLLYGDTHDNVLLCRQRKLPNPSNRLSVELLYPSLIANFWSCNVWPIGEPARWRSAQRLSQLSGQMNLRHSAGLILSREAKRATQAACSLVTHCSRNKLAGHRRCKNNWAARKSNEEGGHQNDDDADNYQSNL